MGGGALSAGLNVRRAGQEQQQDQAGAITELPAPPGALPGAGAIPSEGLPAGTIARPTLAPDVVIPAQQHLLRLLLGVEKAEDPRHVFEQVEKFTKYVLRSSETSARPRRTYVLDAFSLGKDEGVLKPGDRFVEIDFSKIKAARDHYLDQGCVVRAFIKRLYPNNRESFRSCNEYAQEVRRLFEEVRRLFDERGCEVVLCPDGVDDDCFMLRYAMENQDVMIVTNDGFANHVKAGDVSQDWVDRHRVPFGFVNHADGKLLFLPYPTNSD